ncbi:MAG: cobalamin-binding protein [Chloroflexi bacterium]|nr:cobalamin-binding protein [Chloroflexota bacterium]
METSPVFQQLMQSVIDGDAEATEEAARAALAAGVDALQAIDCGLRPGLDAIGRRFGMGDCFLPELVMSAGAMQAGLRLLQPALQQSSEQVGKGRVVLGSVAGDVHDIGKNIVAALLEAAGFTVTDLGVDVDDETFVQAVRDLQPKILGLSALMTTTILRQKSIIAALEGAGLRKGVKVMVGGAVVTAEWARQIGADAHGMDAMDAVQKAEQLVT